jgi:undecaprenyl-diphosphatase
MLLRAEVPPSRRFVAVVGVVAVASLGLFLLIAEDVVDGGGLISRDQAVLAWFVDHRSAWMISVARAVSFVGGFGSLAVLAIVLALWLWRSGRPVALAGSPLLSLCIGGLASTWAKSYFDRARPPVAVHATTVTTAAFPSGHATEAAAMLIAASLVLSITVARHRWTKVAIVLIGALSAGLVGLSRLVLAVHWLSDVVAGWALGTCIAVVVVTIAWTITAR